MDEKELKRIAEVWGTLPDSERIKIAQKMVQDAPVGVDVHERTVGKYLAALGYRRLSVRPQHPDADEAAQEAFKNVWPAPLQEV